MDGCVFSRLGGEVHRERGVCEGAIKAVYYKSVTERVCGDNGGMSLSPFRLCQDDICSPFFFW